MSKYLQIQIPEACHENWDKMDAAKQGRFCNSCQKNVIDFTLMSDNDLVNFFKKNTNNVCGRLTQKQLSSDYLIPSRKIPWLKYFFQIAIPAFLFSAKSNAQIGKIAITPRHIVDKKQVKSQLPIQQIEVRCNPLTALQNTSPSTNNLEDVVVIAGGISAVKITRVNRFIATPWFLKPANPHSFSIFPNPISSNSRLNIKWKDAITADQQVEIYNQAGNLLQQQVLRLNKKTNQQSIDLKQLPAGTYIIKVSDNKTHKFSSQEFIVQ